MQRLIIKDHMDDYLSASKYINWNESSILLKAEKFKQNILKKDYWLRKSMNLYGMR